MSKDEIKAAVMAAAAVAEAIRAAGSVPSGHLYAELMGQIDFGTYSSIVGVLKRTGLVKETNHLLEWTGPVIPAPLQSNPAAKEWSATNRAGLYNNDPELFRNAQRSYEERGIKLQVVDGHIYAGQDGAVARFESDHEAMKCLLEAGYEQQDSEWTPRRMMTAAQHHAHPNGRWS